MNYKGVCTCIGRRRGPKLPTLPFQRSAGMYMYLLIDSGLGCLAQRGSARAEDAQGTPPQSHIAIFLSGMIQIICKKGHLKPDVFPRLRAGGDYHRVYLSVLRLQERRFSTYHCRADSAQIKQSRPDSGLDVSQPVFRRCFGNLSRYSLLSRQQSCPSCVRISTSPPPPLQGYLTHKQTLFPRTQQ